MVGDRPFDHLHIRVLLQEGLRILCQLRRTFSEGAYHTSAYWSSAKRCWNLRKHAQLLP